MNAMSNVMTDTDDRLRALTDQLRAAADADLRAAANVQVTRAQRAEAAWNARQAGVPIRRIGELLGVSHVHVLRLVAAHEKETHA